MPKTPPPPPTKRLVKTSVAAQMYSVSTDYLHKVPMDELPRIKLGHRSVLFDINDLENYFQSKKVA
jgi:hypothetical protein